MKTKTSRAVVAAAVAALLGGAVLYLGTDDEVTLASGTDPRGLDPARAPAFGAVATGPFAGPATPAGASAAGVGRVVASKGAPAAAAVPLNAAAQATLNQLNQLSQLPAGDAAIVLAQQLERGLTPDNAAGYVRALMSTTNPMAERAAMAALARSADSGVMRTLAADYGTLAPEQRGRVLQVFENAANPEALQGLTEVFAADTSEKRSALVMSALVGVAHIGTMESVQFLLSQVTPANADYAFVALGRVQSPQGVEMIRAAASGSKDAAGIDARYLPALKRLAETPGNS